MHHSHGDILPPGPGPISASRDHPNASSRYESRYMYNQEPPPPRPPLPPELDSGNKTTSSVDPRVFSYLCLTIFEITLYLLSFTHWTTVMLEHSIAEFF